MSLLYEEKIPINRTAFVAKVNEICGKLGIPSDWLMFVMNLETAGTMSHTIVNSIGATGLIQFLPSTAALRQMTNVQQLDYVYKYLRTYAVKFKSFEDVYCAVFYPAAIGKADDYIIGSTQVAKQNPLFDINKDWKITKLELRTKLISLVPNVYKDEFLKKKS